jgi:hypothetical protein
MFLIYALIFIIFHYECQKLEKVVKLSLIRGRVEEVGI